MEYIYGKMEENMRDSLKMIIFMVREYIYGLMGIFIMDNGKKENKMVREQK